MSNDRPPPIGHNSDSPIFENDAASAGAARRADEPIFAAKSGEATADATARVFPCEQCGADLKFDIGQQSQKCPFCGFVKQIVIAEGAAVGEQDFRATLERLSARRQEGRDRVEGVKELHCDACGANIAFIGTLTSTECPYCGKPTQRENIHDAPDRVPVDGILPFLMDAQVAAENLRQWVRTRWFAPTNFKRRGADGKFNGVYLPFFTYDSLTFNRYRGERGEHYYVTVGQGKEQRQERRTRWYPTSGTFETFFDDLIVLSAKGLNRTLMHALEPWPLERLVPFNQEMVSGFSARTYDIELEEGFSEAKERIDAAIASEVRQRIGGDEQRVHGIQTSLTAITYKHLLLPAWLLTYRYHDKAYQVFINATTGEVQGERPYSWVKITALVVTILTIVGAIAFFATRG